MGSSQTKIKALEDENKHLVVSNRVMIGLGFLENPDTTMFDLQSSNMKLVTEIESLKLENKRLMTDNKQLLGDCLSFEKQANVLLAKLKDADVKL